MNLVFFGSGKFAIPALKALIASNHNVLCVVTQPDKKKGRGLQLSSTAVKDAVKNLNIKVYQPFDINSVDAVKVLKDFSPDLFVVIAYGQILSEELLDIPKLFALNIHASLLPKFRGAAPINWAIIRGEKNTGITAIKLSKDMDAGPIILQKAVDINIDHNAASLAEKLSRMGAELLIQSLREIESNNYKVLTQDKSIMSFAPKLKKEDGLINWQESAREIHNLIRGCYDWPGAFTHYKGKLLKIFKASVFLSIEDQKNKTIPGQVIKVLKDDFIVSTGKGDLVVEELQIEGKRKMLAGEFIAGHKISVGEVLR